mmetsp:Transcript_16569/g.45530  ORF Transcript_16569/g.45530 Transcript_16569/m.45530 type:complete len:92 (+) Transcript_16569:16-291(+)
MRACEVRPKVRRETRQFWVGSAKEKRQNQTVTQRRDKSRNDILRSHPTDEVSYHEMGTNTWSFAISSCRGFTVAQRVLSPNHLSNIPPLFC